MLIDLVSCSRSGVLIVIRHSPPSLVRRSYTAPFDRHDWIVDRALPADPTSPASPSSVRVRYVIDFYTGRAAHLLLPPDQQGGPPGGVEANFRPNLAFYIDCRPAWDGLEEGKMRWNRWLRSYGFGGEKA